MTKTNKTETPTTIDTAKLADVTGGCPNGRCNGACGQQQPLPNRWAQPGAGQA